MLWHWAGLVALTTGAAFADDQALIDALVRKGILTQKDADTIEARCRKTRQCYRLRAVRSSWRPGLRN